MTLSLIFYGGVGGEVGGNQILIADAEAKAKLLLDFGLNLERRSILYPFPMQPRDKQELVSVGLAPAEDELLSRPFPGPVQAALLSHPHADHTLGICLLPGGTPVLASPECLAMMVVRRSTHRPGPEDQVGHLSFGQLEHGRRHELAEGRAVLTPYYVDHSAIGSMAFLLEVGGKLVAYTGDIRFHGPLKARSLDFERVLEKARPDVLIVEGTNVFEAKMVSEDAVREDLTKILEEAPGFAIVDVHPGDIWRVSSVVAAAKEAGRDVLVPLRLVATLRALRQQAPTSPGMAGITLPDVREPNVLIYVRPKKRLERWERELLKACEEELGGDKIAAPEVVAERPGELVLISEYPVIDLREIRPPEGTVLIHAQSEPFNELGMVEYETLRAWLRQFGIPTLHAHSSGHASLMRLAKLVERAQPDVLVVVHTPEPGLCQKFFRRFCDKVITPSRGEELSI